MEEIIKNIGEQPMNNSLTLSAEEQQNLSETQAGSPIQKFKSVDELSKAYENLEREFTQKCQKIRELTDKVKNLDNAQKNAPEYESSDWEEMVKNFFDSNPMAKNYADEISKVLETDKDIANSKNSLQNALTKILANRFVPPEKLALDDEFLEKYIYKNKKVSEKIINDYLDDLQSNRSLPLITSGAGSGTFSSPVKKPKTIKDAGKMVEAYFKN